jgi:hypothetical protein
LCRVSCFELLSRPKFGLVCPNLWPLHILETFLKKFNHFLSVFIFSYAILEQFAGVPTKHVVQH